MANEDTKNFNAMLHDSKDMPKIQIITDRKSIEKYGGNKMYFAPPLDYDCVMKRVPYGRVTTGGDTRIFRKAERRGLYRADHSGDLCLHRGVGEPSALRGRNAVLEDAEGERGTQRKISGRNRVTEGKAGGGGTCHPLQRPKKHPVLCKGL